MPNMSEKREEEYLGDGLYASFDGWNVILRAPRLEGDHWIGLEPATWIALESFIGKIWPRQRRSP